MPHEIIMPALGMAQDSAVLLAWRKQPGEAVKADEILLEVETDKSAMEIEAGHDGYIAELRSPEGADVPVGQVIAIISEDEPDNPTGPDSVPAPEPEAAKPVQEPEPVSAPPPAPEPAPPAPRRPRNNDRVLASPKARRLAAGAGIALQDMLARGMAEPLQAADVDRFKLTRPAGGGGTSQIEAQAGAAPFDLLTTWLAGLSSTTDGAARIWAAFAGAALRAATERDDALTIEIITGGDQQSDAFTDPDLVGLSRLDPAPAPTEPDLSVRDLSDTGLSAARLAGSGAPVLSASRDGDRFTLCLTFDETRLPVDRAVRLLRALVARLNQPLTHIL